jgi:hypothetical protein
MEAELDRLQLHSLQKDVEMEPLELFGSNSKILCIYLMEMLRLRNTQHYLLRMANNTRMRTQLQKI